MFKRLCSFFVALFFIISLILSGTGVAYASDTPATSYPSSLPPQQAVDTLLTFSGFTGTGGGVTFPDGSSPSWTLALPPSQQYCNFNNFSGTFSTTVSNTPYNTSITRTFNYKISPGSLGTTTVNTYRPSFVYNTGPFSYSQSAGDILDPYYISFSVSPNRTSTSDSGVSSLYLSPSVVTEFTLPSSSVDPVEGKDLNTCFLYVPNMSYECSFLASFTAKGDQYRSIGVNGSYGTTPATLRCYTQLRPSYYLLSVVSDGSIVYIQPLDPSDNTGSSSGLDVHYFGVGSLALNIPAPRESLYFVVTAIYSPTSATSFVRSLHPDTDSTNFRRFESAAWTFSFTPRLWFTCDSPIYDPSTNNVITNAGMYAAFYHSDEAVVLPPVSDNQDVLDQLSSMGATQEQYHLEVMSAIDSMQIAQQATTDAVNNQTEKIEEQTEEIKTGFAGILYSLQNLPQTLFDGIVHLFVPTAEELQEVVDEYRVMFDAKLGFIAQTGTLLADLFDAILHNIETAVDDTSYRFHFPGVVFDMPNSDGTSTSFTIIEEQDVNIANDYFTTLRPWVSIIVIIICSFTILNTLVRLFEAIFISKSGMYFWTHGGENMHDLTEEYYEADYDKYGLDDVDFDTDTDFWEPDPEVDSPDWAYSDVRDDFVEDEFESMYGDDIDSSIPRVSHYQTTIAGRISQPPHSSRFDPSKAARDSYIKRLTDLRRKRGG